MYQVHVNGRKLFAGISLALAVKLANSRASGHALTYVRRADSVNVSHVGHYTIEQAKAFGI